MSPWTCRLRPVIPFRGARIGQLCGACERPYPSGRLAVWSVLLRRSTRSTFDRIALALLCGVGYEDEDKAHTIQMSTQARQARATDHARTRPGSQATKKQQLCDKSLFYSLSIYRLPSAGVGPSRYATCDVPVHTPPHERSKRADVRLRLLSDSSRPSTLCNKKVRGLHISPRMQPNLAH